MLPYSIVTNPRLEKLLVEYGKSHQNKINILIHWIFEPSAIYAVLALFWDLKIPFSIADIPEVRGMTLVIICLLLYFAWLSPPLAVVLTFFATVFSYWVKLLAVNITIPIWQFALQLFLVSWTALFLGHKIEGNFPSVFKNPHLIFIGPVWLLAKSGLVQKKSG